MKGGDYMNFSEALEILKDNERVYRDGWNGKGMFLEIQRPDENSKMGKPYIYIKVVTGELVPWVASNGDLFGNDWQMCADESDVAKVG